MKLFIDISKAQLNFSKLVKKPVQVKGQGGKTFTRMQWVSPEDASTGHGVRKITNRREWDMAHQQGIDMHPQYHEALEHQKFNGIEHHKESHPPIHLPESEMSANIGSMVGTKNMIPHNAPSSTKTPDTNTSKTEEKLGVDKEGLDSIRDTFNLPESLKDYAQDIRDLNLDPEGDINDNMHELYPSVHKHLDAIVDHASNSIKEDPEVSPEMKEKQMNLLSENRRKFHEFMKLAESGEDKYVHKYKGPTARRAYNSILAMHPDILKHALHSAIGGEAYSKISEKLTSSSNLTINYSNKNGRFDKIKEEGYKPITNKEIFEQSGYSGWDEFTDKYSKEDIRDTDDFMSKWEKDHGKIEDKKIKARLDAEHKLGIHPLDDDRPTYVAYNPYGFEGGGAVDYGDDVLDINPAILKNSTATDDDSFATEFRVPKVHDMEHLANLFMLSNTYGMSRSEGGVSGEGFMAYEVQHHGAIDSKHIKKYEPEGV